MKAYLTALFSGMLLLIGTTASFAIELAALDRVSVLMPKAEVLAILGVPDKVTDLEGLAVELYQIHDAAPLLSVGLFYEHERALAGNTLIFKGNTAAATLVRLKQHGFRALEEKGDYLRLEGKDDDTGRPVIVTISRLEDLTTVTTFEKTFYEQRSTR